MSDHVVIVGAGNAAGQAAASLRQEGYEGAITMIGNEPYIPYQRPPLSKKFLAGEIGIDRVYFKPPEFYEKEIVTVKLGTRVTEIDRKTKTVHTDQGETLTYSKLLLTTGSRVRELNLPGFDLDGVFYLRNVGDVEGIQSYFNKGGKCVIVGGGYIGLEVAAVAAKHGIDVTVLEMAPMVMARVVDPIVSRFYERVHKEEGVNILTGAAVSGFEGKNGQLTKVTCADGTAHEADFVVVGVGILPNVELAVEANLKVENGIAVDDCCRTSDPDIYAAGDCTNHPNPLLGERLRLESVHNALEQAKTAAAAICGKEKPYAQIPWFWSDQYDLKLQIVGLSAGYDQAVVRGNPEEGRSFAVFYLKEGRLIAVDAINDAKAYVTGKKLLDNGLTADKALIADPATDLKQLLA